MGWNTFSIERSKDIMQTEMISWEMAKDKYGVSESYLEMIAIMTNKSLCDAEKKLVKDVWNN